MPLVTPPLVSSGLTGVKVLEAAKTTPIERKAKMKVGDENMFVHPNKVVAKDDKGTKRKEYRYIAIVPPRVCRRSTKLGVDDGIHERLHSSRRALPRKHPVDILPQSSQ